MIDHRGGIDQAVGNSGGGVSTLDMFRGLVCLQIVTMHAFATRMRPAIEEAIGEFGGYWLEHVRFGYGTFFVIAGYFLADSFRPGNWSVLSVPGFFLRRLARLVIPYYAAIAFGIGTFALSAWIRGRPYGAPIFSELVPLLLFVQDLVPTRTPSITYWFMAPLIQFHLIWGALFWLTRRTFLQVDPRDYHDRAVFTLMPLVVVAFCWCLWFSLLKQTAQWSLSMNGVFLSLGMMSRWRATGRFKAVFPAAAAALLIAGWELGNTRFMAASVASVILIVLDRFRRIRPDPLCRSLAQVGTWSYSIYLTHTYVVYRAMNIESHLGRSLEPKEAILMLLSAVGGSVVLGWLFHQFVEEPARLLSRTIVYRSALTGVGDRKSVGET